MAKKTDNKNSPETIAKRAKSKRERLSLKEELFAKKFVENKGNGTKTALEVYDTTNENTGATIASDNIRKPKIRDKIAFILEGVEDKAKLVVQAGLDATAQSNYEGEVFSSDLPDYAERRKMLALVGSFGGWNAPKQVESVSLAITAKYESMDEQALRGLLEEKLAELA